MIFQVPIKDSDAFHFAIVDAVEEEVTALGLNSEEGHAVADMRTKAADEFIARWVEDGEYMVVEFDTEAGTAVVKEIER